MRKTPLVLATVVVLGVLVWLWTGHFFVFPKVVNSAVDAAGAPVSGSTVVTPERLSSTAESYAAPMRISGRTEPSAALSVAAEVQGKISAWSVAAGDKVALGQRLAMVDASDRKIKLQAAQAAYNLQDQRYAVAHKLAAKGFSSKVALKDAYSQRESALYDLKMAQLDVGNLDILAPVAGVVEQRLLEVGSWVIPGTAVAQMLVLDPLKVVADISSTERVGLYENLPVTVDIEGFGTRPGKVSFLGHQADAKTRTFRVEFACDNPDQTIPAGLSATVLISKEPQLAHKVPGTALHHEEDQVGVLILDKTGQQKFMPVTILSFDEGQAWVSGLPETVNLVGMGGAFHIKKNTSSAANVPQNKASSDANIH